MINLNLQASPEAACRRQTPVADASFKEPAYWLPWLVAGLVAWATAAPAQVALRDAVANDTAATARSLQQQSQDYTYKNGDFRLLVTPALNLQWIDNPTLSSSNVESDFVIQPTVGVLTSYPLSEQNLLQLNFTAGYNAYVREQYLDSFFLQSGSGLSFDIHLKDILINLHDQFSYEQDSAQNSALANTGNYGIFQNSLGLSVSEDLTKINLSAGYDHQNVLFSGSQFSGADHATENFFCRGGYVFNSRLTAGLEASAAFTTYDQTGSTNGLSYGLNNNQAYSVGVYATFQPDEFLQIQPRVGYIIMQFDQTSQSLSTSDLNSWYADLNLTHAITKAISYSLDIGRSVSGGVQSDVVQTYYVTPGATWNFRKDWTVQVSLSYNYGQQGTGSTLLAPNSNLVSEDFTWYTGTLGFSHAITSRLNVSFDYRFTERSSTAQLRGYTQNELDLQLTYHPK